MNDGCSSPAARRMGCDLRHPSRSATRTVGMSTRMPERAPASLMAVAVLVGGAVHLRLYFDGYRDIPVGHIGAQFLLNAIAAAVIALGLVGSLVAHLVPRWVGRVAAGGGIVWAAIALVAFAMARSSGGWFAFQDQPGLNPSPEAGLAVFAECIAVLLGVAVVVVGVLADRRSAPAVVGSRAAA